MKRGFTLVEMLVVIVILLILVATALAFLGPWNSAKSAANAGNIVQAGALRAKAKAADSGERRGIRLIRIPGEKFVTSFVSIGGPDSFDQKSQPAEFVDLNNPAIRTPNPNAAQIRATTNPGDKFSTISQLTPIWSRLETSGALSPSGAELVVHGHFYRIRKVGGVWQTTRPIFEPHANALIDYTIRDLALGIMPNQEPRELPKGVVIDLEYSSLPLGWKLPSGDYSDRMDIVFSPAGKRIGPMAADSGTVMLLITHLEDIGKRPGDPTKNREEAVVAIFDRGKVAVSPIDDTDANNNGVADDPFNYAHLGREKR